MPTNTNSNAVFTFNTRTWREGGYSFTEIEIRSADRTPLVKDIEGCKDNKAGYQTREIAEEQGRKFARILAAGHKYTYDSICNESLRVELRWQHYDNGTGELDYCEPKYECLGRRLESLERGVKFLRKLGGIIEKQRAEAGSSARKPSNHSFGRPDRVLAALRSMKGFVEIAFNRELDMTLAVLPTNATHEAA